MQIKIMPIFLLSILPGTVLLTTACPPPGSAPDGADPGDAGQTIDGQVFDTAPPDTTRTDGAVGDTLLVDLATTPSTTVAVVGSTCENSQRIGMVELGDEYGSVWVWARVFDKPHPVYGNYAISDGNCGFHQAAAPTTCDPCQGGQICGALGDCEDLPVVDTNAQLLLQAGAQQQQLQPDTSGLISGEVTLAGQAFSANFSWSQHAVTLAETLVPEELTGISGTIVGGSETPTGIDLSWTSPSNPANLYIMIPINHHVGGLTFTECSIDAADGSLHIDGLMLQPLAVSTGLEVNDVQHVTFAAAHTPVGCVEFRYSRRHMVNWQ